MRLKNHMLHMMQSYCPFSNYHLLLIQLYTNYQSYPKPQITWLLLMDLWWSVNLIMCSHNPMLWKWKVTFLVKKSSYIHDFPLTSRTSRFLKRKFFEYQKPTIINKSKEMCNSYHLLLPPFSSCTLSWGPKLLLVAYQF